MVIKEIKNIFVFEFFAQSDKNHVLNEGPWSFDGHLLLLKQMTGVEQPSEVKFTIARIWMKAYVQVLRLTPSFAKTAW